MGSPAPTYTSNSQELTPTNLQPSYSKGTPCCPTPITPTNRKYHLPSYNSHTLKGPPYPVLLGNQSMQENEKNMDTGTFTSGSTTLNRHPMLSTLTHPRRVPQNFQQLEMESSNMVALPCFNYNAEAATHMETPKNVHDKETLSTNLKMDTNMDTNHMAHRYRHTEKEAHLLSGPSELQPPDEAQKFRSSTQVQQPRQEYSRFTETEKATFQTPSTYNDERNFVWHNSVNKFSPKPCLLDNIRYFLCL